MRRIGTESNGQRPIQTAEKQPETRNAIEFNFGSLSGVLKIKKGPR
jgi:hypothetical protein